MRFRILSFATIAIMLLGSVGSTRAFETDQYDLPPRPLADIGDEFSQHVAEMIAEALKKVNEEMALHESCLNGSAARGVKCDSTVKETKRLAELRSEDAIVEAVYKLLGEGDLFTTNTGKWFGKHKFANEPSRYKPSYAQSIFLTRPINYATLSPTVRMYGVEFGFDKIDHFFQQGYKYYRKYNEARRAGKTAEQAAEKAISWGRMTERTYFGSLVSGVYSNGDLFANYAGMKFYEGLTKGISMSGHQRPAIVVLKDNKWMVDYDVDLKADLLRPFIADHLNEALNPSGYSFFLHKVVRKHVRDHSCKDWRAVYPNATSAEFQKRTTDLEKWNGEDYGFTHKSRSVPIAICFEEKLSAE
jgi:hypothetical protein